MVDLVLVDVDGGNEFGVGYELIKEDIDVGYVWVDEMNCEFLEKLIEFFLVYFVKDMWVMKVECYINGMCFVWLKWKVIVVVLNIGNDDNMVWLLVENVYFDQCMLCVDLEVVFDILDKCDWDFV